MKSTPAEHLILEKIKMERPPIHSNPDGKLRCVGLSSSSLDLIFANLTSEFHTLETGCGLSTLIFALCGCKHTAIVPNPKHIKHTKKIAEDVGISLNNVTFVQERSEDYLPTLTLPHELDVVLIDGGHAFPIPILDWYFTNKFLKKSGLLILDDIHLKTINVLFQFLKKQPEWIKVKQDRKTVFFQKMEIVNHDHEWDFWRTQPFNTGFRTQTDKFLASIKSIFQR